MTKSFSIAAAKKEEGWMPLLAYTAQSQPISRRLHIRMDEGCKCLRAIASIMLQ